MSADACESGASVGGVESEGDGAEGFGDEGEGSAGLDAAEGEDGGAADAVGDDDGRVEVAWGPEDLFEVAGDRYPSGDAPRRDEPLGAGAEMGAGRDDVEGARTDGDGIPIRVEPLPDFFDVGATSGLDCGFESGAAIPIRVGCVEVLMEPGRTLSLFVAPGRLSDPGCDSAGFGSSVFGLSAGAFES